MNSRKFGTVLVVLHRPDFVILGSDTGKLEEMKTGAGQGSKIVCHSSLPLAVAVGGLAEFTINNKTTVVTHLLETQMAAWSGRVNLRDVMLWANRLSHNFCL